MKKCKKCGKMKKAIKLPTGMDVVPTAVGAGVILGVGATVLGQMGQGAVAGSIITPAANMMGPVVTAGMGMGVLDYIGKKSKEMKKK